MMNMTSSSSSVSLSPEKYAWNFPDMLCWLVLLLSVSSGEFANDRISGQGEMQYADGSIYKGQWIDNQVCDFHHLNSPHSFSEVPF